MGLTEFIRQIKDARKFAQKAHAGQFRRGKKGEKKLEFFTHPEAVAKIVWHVKSSNQIANLITAAYLHDTVEDNDDVNIEDIEEKFGKLVSSLVSELTSDKELIQKLSKEKYLTEKMLNMTSWGLVIKLADRLHNVQDIPEKLMSNDPEEQKWAKKYAKQTANIIKTLEEKRLLSSTQEELIELIKERIKGYYN